MRCISIFPVENLIAVPRGVETVMAMPDRENWNESRKETSSIPFPATASGLMFFSLSL